MTRALVFRPAVARDLAGAFDWYEERRSGLGEDFLSSVTASFESIRLHPEMFAVIHGDVRRAVVSRFPYAVFYWLEPRRIVVLTVLHTSRDPQLWPRARRRSR